MKRLTTRSARRAATMLGCAALLCTTGRAAAGEEYAEIARLKGMNETVRGIRSMNDGEHYTTLEGNDIRRYAYASEERGVSLLPMPAPNLEITDYLLSPDERSILIASGSHPIYRHSRSSATDAFNPSCARPRLRATQRSRPTGGGSPTPTATTSMSTTSRRSTRSGSPTTAAGTR